MSDITRSIVEDLFLKTASGTIEEIADLFSDRVDWYIAGNLTTVPWIGLKFGKAGVADFYRQIREHIQSERFEIDEILVKGDRAIVVGDLESRVKKTGKLIKSEFAFDLTVQEEKIVRFRMFEDSFAVAQAAV